MTTRIKCNRTVCQNEGVLRHTQNNALYCVRCARRINEANPGLVDWPSKEELVDGHQLGRRRPPPQEQP